MTCGRVGACCCDLGMLLCECAGVGRDRLGMPSCNLRVFDSTKQSAKLTSFSPQVPQTTIGQSSATQTLLVPALVPIYQSA